jgi:hypothetical protein
MSLASDSVEIRRQRRVQKSKWRAEEVSEQYLKTQIVGSRPLKPTDKVALCRHHESHRSVEPIKNPCVRAVVDDFGIANI